MEASVMVNLSPTHTKARLYLGSVGDHSLQRSMANAFRERLDLRYFDAIAVTETLDHSVVIEVVGERKSIRDKLVPFAHEALPGAFVTMEAVCAFKVHSPMNPCL
jgi:hypothetical protein